MKRYVIIGNGVGAAGCIEGIRSVDPDGAVTVISEEEHPVYCRPLISYLLEGKTNADRIRYRDGDYYGRMNCEVLYGRKAVKILPEKREVLLEDGSSVPYDELCIATGSSPFVPPFEGLDTVERKHSFMTLDDALELDRSLREEDDVFIIGAGLIGLKCAEGIAKRVRSVTVTDLADRILSSILDSDCASLMQRHLEQNGMKFLLNDSVTRFEKDQAQMKSGAVVRFSVLILAVGVRPNIGLFKEIGGETGRGILTDEKMATSVPNIWAAGDCVQTQDVSSGEKKIMAILPNAVMQGCTAGVNMAGGDSSFDKGIPMNSIGFFGYHAMTAGSYEGELFEEKTQDSLKRLFTENDRLKGFILIGCHEKAGIYTSMIREKTPLSSVNFDLMRKSATTAAFSSDVRRKKFGGVV